MARDERATSRPRAEWAGRLALALLGLVLSVPVLELFLQVGAAINRHTLGPRMSEGLVGYRRLLAMGDSNTFGLGVRREQSYPSVLERLWNRSHHTPGRLQVLNAGYPGMTSPSILSTLPRFIRAFRPDIILVMVGANDGWTAIEPAVFPDDENGFREWLWRTSRVYRLAFMAQRWLEHPTLELREVDLTGHAGSVRYGDVEFSVRQVDPEGSARERARRLRTNVEAIAATAEEHGIPLFLLTYPEGRGWTHPIANVALRGTARARDLPLVDVNAAFTRLCHTGCPDLIIPNDGHPTARGHLLVAKLTLHAVLRHVRRTSPPPRVHGRDERNRDG
jgi:lysophospholipase L1-like esterase